MRQFVPGTKSQQWVMLNGDYLYVPNLQGGLNYTLYHDPMSFSLSMLPKESTSLCGLGKHHSQDFTGPQKKLGLNVKSKSYYGFMLEEGTY